MASPAFAGLKAVINGSGGSGGGGFNINLGAGLTTTAGSQNSTPVSSGSPNIFAQAWPDTYTSSSTVSAADAGGLSICNSTSSLTLTLPAVGTTGFVEATPFNFLNENTGTCTIASSSSLVGASSFALAQYSSLSCTPDATKWNCAASGAGGSGAVSSVSNSDSTLTISPTTGSVIASLNLAHANTWTAGQAVTPATVTISTATFTPNLASSNNHNITLVHASCPCTLANPTNIVPGESGVIVVNQSSTGSDLISTYGSDYVFTNGAAPTLSTAANAVDELSYYVVDSTHIRIAPLTSTSQGAPYQVSFQPGLLTAITNTIGVFGKVSKSSTVDNMTASAVLLTCATNPTVTMYECGTSTTCAAPTTIASVQVTASGTATPATVSNSAITAGDYIGFAISAGTCVLSTTSSNDVIIIWAYSASTPGVVSISDTAGLSWAIRGTSHSWNAGAWRAEEWYAIAPSPLSSDSITVTYSGSPGRMIAFGISGANTVTPFDPNASLQAFTQSTGSSASVTVTTNNANDMLISTVRINGSIGTATEPSGFTNLISAGGAQDASYKIELSLKKYFTAFAICAALWSFSAHALLRGGGVNTGPVYGLNWGSTATQGPFTLLSGINTYLVDQPDGTTPSFSDLSSLRYHHHTRVAVDSGGRVWVAYSGNLTVEQENGLATEVNSSTNNFTTSTGPIIVVAPPDNNNTSCNVTGRVSYPRAFITYNSQLYLVAAIDSMNGNYCGNTNQVGLALVAVACNPNGTIGTPFLISPSSGYTPNSGFPSYTYDGTLGPPLFTLANIFGTWGGSAPGQTASAWIGYTSAGDGSTLTELDTIAFAVNPNTLYRTWRSVSGSNQNLNYYAVSTDAGMTFSTAIPTNIPNEPSATASIQLANGHIVLLGNVLDQASTTDSRDPLYLAVFNGSNGMILNVWAIAQNLPGPTYNEGVLCGAIQRPCGASYAGAWEASGNLYKLAASAATDIASGGVLNTASYVKAAQDIFSQLPNDAGILLTDVFAILNTEVSFVLEVFQWVVSAIFTIGSAIMGFLFMKTNRMEEALTAHVLHVEQTYAKIDSMHEGFRNLNSKLDDTQKSVQAIALVQATQTANIVNMGRTLNGIADSLKDKTT
ncbi:unnamed protein product [Sphagnum compactum]